MFSYSVVKVRFPWTQSSCSTPISITWHAVFQILKHFSKHFVASQRTTWICVKYEENKRWTKRICKPGNIPAMQIMPNSIRHTEIKTYYISNTFLLGCFELLGWNTVCLEDVMCYLITAWAFLSSTFIGSGARSLPALYEQVIPMENHRYKIISNEFYYLMIACWLPNFCFSTGTVGV